ncbi:hypothetical protein IEO21_07228 [Rhodonia placenta]|uniref:Carboxypeptidase n=1 Tax=Rhodonia placenta TaxID=104341 RepID=A0A8H7NYD6_9APHY|nr:hypothetical protein IEO21_07228 [Postia placenta]
MLSALLFGWLWPLLAPTLLLPFTAAAPQNLRAVPSAASFYVYNLPDLHQDEQHPLHIFSGHLSADPEASKAPATDVISHLFFVLIKARRTADKERIVFWLNGGPGCSSFDGLMMEVGPWRQDGKGGYKTIEGGWEEYTTMVYVDQPAGTGFSYTSTNHYLHELPEASRQFVEFLKNFYDVFPEYKNVEMYIAGESYAGQYIPYFADAVLNSTLNVPLRGAAIGNGWMDGRHQYPSFLEYAVKHGLVEEGSEDWKRGKAATDKCMTEFIKYTTVEPVKVDICESVMNEVIMGKNHKSNGTEMCVNIYDVRLEDTSPSCGMHWPPDLDPMYKYLARPEVVRALHASAASQTWQECRGIIHTEFAARKSPSAITVIPKVLEKIPMLFFAGDQDLICNYVGIESMIQAMTWNGAKGLGEVETQSWTVNGSAAGTWVTSRNLTYAKIFNASHMVGFDAPHITHDMILRFMGMNFSAITAGSARIPSTVGKDVKPLPALLEATPSASPSPAKTPEQDKAMWEAYYNAGSAALLLLLIAILLGVWFWWRSRRARLRGLPVSTNEENIPLSSNMEESNGHGPDDVGGERFQSRKGKERATQLTPEQAIFSVGDEEDEEDRSPRI